MIYISMLRGINVSGHKLIKMDALRKMYESLGFENVTSYLQSGNVVFATNEPEREKLEQKISQQIKKVFGFEVCVRVLTLQKLKQIVDQNTMLKDPDKDKSFFHVTVLSAKPEDCNPQLIEDKKQNGEEIAFTDDAVYLYCPNGYGRTKLTTGFLETKLKVPATTRNWKTMNELVKIADPAV